MLSKRNTIEPDQVIQHINQASPLSISPFLCLDFGGKSDDQHRLGSMLSHTGKHVFDLGFNLSE